MTTKHTPGPWIGAGPSFGDPLPRYTTEIITEYEVDDGEARSICELPLAHHDDENEANARLIAAAPELLAALQAFIDGGYDRETAITAIAKAAGEQA